MNNIFTVFKYELKTSLKSKTFITSTLIFMALVIIGALVIRFASTDMGKDFQETFEETSYEADSKGKDLGVVLFEEGYSKENVNEIYLNYNLSFYKNEEELKKDIEDEKIFQGLIFKSKEDLKIVYKKAPIFALASDLYVEEYRSFLINSKLMERGISLSEVENIKNSVRINTEVESIEGDDTIAKAIGSAVSITLYILILINGQMAAMNVAREKNDRTMELLITSTESSNLIHGKVMSSFVQSFVTVLAIALAFGIGVLINFDGVKMLWSMILEMDITMDLVAILIFIGFFVLGYTLYLYVYAALGATVSNTEEINTALGPITIIVVIVYLAAIMGLSIPNSDNLILKILSYVPFSSMFVVHTSYAIGNMSIMDVGLSFGVLLVTTLVLSAISVKIYRNASLNYGNRNKLTKKIKKILKK